jgi:hypothetical protein
MMIIVCVSCHWVFGDHYTHCGESGKCWNNGDSTFSSKYNCMTCTTYNEGHICPGSSHCCCTSSVCALTLAGTSYSKVFSETHDASDSSYITISSSLSYFLSSSTLCTQCWIY